MSSPPYDEEIAMRAMQELKATLWTNGPTLGGLVDRFTKSAVGTLDLDAWLPLASPKTQPIVAYFFHGLALRLADRLIVHPKVAWLALTFTCINYLLPGKPPLDTMTMMEKLATPALDGSNRAEGFHMLGARAADEWLANGFDSDPPMHQLKEVLKLIEEYAVEDARNPEGIADLAAKLTRSKRSKIPNKNDK